MMTMANVNVILVHGTFAKHAPWTQKGSPLRQFLQDNTPANITYHVFEWSGWNSYLTRIAASGRLSAFVAHIADVFPDAPIFIIAHSHGGNIALYALRDAATAGRVAGLITLSTPFLCVRPREFNAIGRAGLSCALVVILFAGLYFSAMPCDYLVRLAFGSRNFCSAHDIVSFPLYVLYCVIIGIVMSTFGRVVRWLTDNLSLPNIPTDTMLVVRGPSDEASGFLGALHFLETLVASLSERHGAIDRFVRSAATFLKGKRDDVYYNYFIRRWALISTITGGSIIFAAIAISRLVQVVSPSYHSILSGLYYDNENIMLALMVIIMFPAYVVVLYWLFIMVSVVAVAATVGVTCIASLTIISVLFRPGLGPFSGALVVSVEPCAPGLFQVLQIDGSGTRSFLWHSATYTHPAALRGIATWVSGRLAQLGTVRVQK